MIPSHVVWKTSVFPKTFFLKKVRYFTSFPFDFPATSEGFSIVVVEFLQVLRRDDQEKLRIISILSTLILISLSCATLEQRSLLSKTKLPSVIISTPHTISSYTALGILEPVIRCHFYQTRMLKIPLAMPAHCAIP
jgi:hypothetical protein